MKINIFFIFFLLVNLSFCNMEISLNLYGKDFIIDDISANFLNVNGNITIDNNIIFGNSLQMPLMMIINNLPIINNPSFYLTIENNKLSYLNINAIKSLNSVLNTTTLINQEITNINSNNFIIESKNILIGNQSKNTVIFGESVFFNTPSIQIDVINDPISSINLILNNNLIGKNCTIENTTSLSDIFKNVNNLKNNIIFKEEITINDNTSIHANILFNDQVNLEGDISFHFTINQNIENPYYLILNQNNMLRKTNIPPKGLENNIVNIISSNNSRQIILKAENNNLLIKSNFWQWPNSYFINYVTANKKYANINFNYCDINSLNNIDNFNTLAINNLFLDQIINISLLCNRSVIINNINSTSPNISIFNKNILFQKLLSENTLDSFLIAQKIDGGDYANSYYLYKVNSQIFLNEIKNIDILEKLIDEKKLEIDIQIKQNNTITYKIQLIKKENQTLLFEIIELLKIIKNYLTSKNINYVDKNKIKNHLFNILKEIK
jgi:hypothetical protein